MPQEFIPFFSDSGEGYISDLLSFQKHDGSVYYFHGAHPVFSHPEDDQKSFRLITSQFVVNGRCRQVDIVRAFGVSPISVKRSVKKYREGGAAAFFQTPRTRGSSVLTGEVLSQAQELLNQGYSKTEVAERLEIKPNTFLKAVRSGRLTEPVKKKIRTGEAKASGA
jgi:transposase-like protein